MTTERPSDEATAKVVSECNDLPHPHLHYEYCNKTDVGWFIDPSDEDTDEYPDPRDDDGAALGLLNRTLSEHKALYNIQPDDGWRIYYGMHILALIPISGQPFRYAVVALAIKVMGIEETK